MTKKIKAVITDLDGVIRFFPKSRDIEFEKKYSLPRGSLIECAFNADDLQLAITGKIKDSDWRLRIARKLSEKYKVNDSEIIVNSWSEFVGEINKEALLRLQEARKSVPLVLMTNATDRLFSDLNKLGIHNKFDYIINSSKLGFAKPSFEIFQHALNYLSLRPEEIVFIDDSKSIVDKAAEMNFIAYWHKTNKDFDESLKNI